MLKKLSIKNNLVILLIAIILGLSVSLQIKTNNATNAAMSRDIDELQNNIRSYADKNRELNDRNESLYNEIERLRSNKLQGDTSYQEILAEKEKYQIFAGMTEVQNSGLKIEMSFNGLAKMNDSLLRLVINELNAVGAQAISINEQRKVATTEIRASADNIIINGVSFPRTDSFEIKAIIAHENLDYAASMLESLKRTVMEQISNDNLQMTIKVEENIIIPALSADSIAYKTDLLLPVNPE